VSPGVLFWPSSWSPDGALLAGRATREGQAQSLALYSLASGTYRLLPPDLEVSSLSSIAFVDSGRLVAPSGAALWLVDLDRGETVRLASAAPGHRYTNVSISADRRSLTWIDRTDESDIWLMTLDDTPSAAKAKSGAQP